MRTCGPCSECCYVLGVHEVDKRDWAHCKHERRSSAGVCGIYKSRPESCATFQCVWLAGQLEKKDRPDRLGIVFATADMDVRQIVIAYVRKPGADKTGRGAELLEIIAQQVPVAIVRWDGTRSIMAGEQFAELIAPIKAELNAQAVIDGDGKLRRLPLV